MRFVEAACAIAIILSKSGWNGCKENGDIENCLTRGCPCGKYAVKIFNPPLAGDSCDTDRGKSPP